MIRSQTLAPLYRTEPQRLHRRCGADRAQTTVWGRFGDDRRAIRLKTLLLLLFAAATALLEVPWF